MATLGRITATVLLAMLLGIALIGLIGIAAFINDMAAGSYFGFWVGASASLAPVSWRFFK